MLRENASLTTRCNPHPTQRITKRSEASSGMCVFWNGARSVVLANFRMDNVADNPLFNGPSTLLRQLSERKMQVAERNHIVRADHEI